MAKSTIVTSGGKGTKTLSRRSNFILNYQRSPIIFTNGIASQISGGLLPIINITQGQNFDQGITGSSTTINDDTSLFEFMPMAGSKLASFQNGKYPFANQAVAANAIIAEPLTISMRMEARTREDNGGYSQRLSAFQALQKAIYLHASKGGTYTVMTPSYIYVNCLLLDLRDASDGNPKFPQSAWIWEFEQPLITLDAAGQAQNNLYQALTNSTLVTPDNTGAISGNSPQVSLNNPASGFGPAVVPSSTPLAGATAAGPTPIYPGVPGP